MNPTVAEVTAVIAAGESSGISPQGVITIAFFVAVAIALRQRRKHPARPPAPEAPPAPPERPCVGSGDLMAYAVREVPPMPSEPPRTHPSEAHAPETQTTPDEDPWAQPHETPSPQGDWLEKEMWAQMCREKGLNGLEFVRTEKTVFGTDVHVLFRDSMHFAKALGMLPQIEAGLDKKKDWRIQVKTGDSSGRGIIRIVTKDPLAGMTPWVPAEKPVRLADPLWISQTPFGDRVELSVKRRIGIFGTSGAGKSCTQRLVASHVIQAVDADLEIWDLKYGIESQHYEGRARRVTTVEDAVVRLEEIFKHEFPRRAARMLELKTSAWEETPQDRALIIIIDEGNSLVRGFSREQMKGLATMIEQGRALGVYFVWATQYPKAENLPTEIRSQLDCRISMRMNSSEESQLVYKDEYKDGWAPHQLIGPGWMLIKDTEHTQPEESKGLWLSADVLRTVPLGTPVPEDGLLRRDTCPSGGDTPVSEMVWGELMLSSEPLGVSELSRRTGRSKSAVSEALSRMERDGEVCRTGTDTRPLWCLPLSGD